MTALPSGKKPRERPRTRWWKYVEDLAWSSLEISPAELPLVIVQEIEMLEDPNSSCCPLQSQNDKRA